MQIERVVVGMDFSAPAIAGARWVSEHLAPSAELILVHVLDLPAPPPFARDALPAPEMVEAAARDYAEARLRDLTDCLTARTTRTMIRVGPPHGELAAVAAETGADLLVVGPHGERSRPWKLLGTTAERLVRVAPVPVLVAANTRDAAPRRLLVAVDDAPATPLVLDWVRDLAAAFAPEVTLLHVLSTATVAQAGTMATAASRSAAGEADGEQVKATTRALAQRWLESLATGLGRARTEATFGKSGDAILAAADSMRADLIVLGRRAAGSVSFAVLGSTVNTVLHGARCPVLVVPDDRGAAWT